MKLIDTHCHLDFPDFKDDLDNVIQRAAAKGLEYIINVGSSLEGSRASVNLAKKYKMIYAAIGFHPHEADKFNDEALKEIRHIIKQDKVVAIGEVGLDYYRNLSSHDAQKKVFIQFLHLAKEFNLPFIIHNRQANDNMLEILKRETSLPLKGVVHCFSGDENFLKECLRLGLFISFTCNITYKKSENLRNLAKLAPLDRLLLETDAPFLSPEGFRGKRNEPAYVELLAKELASIKGMGVDEISEITTQNAKRLFGLL